MTDLTDVTGVGLAMATKLEMIGIRTIEDLAQADPDRLRVIRGLGPIRIHGIIVAAQANIARHTGAPIPGLEVIETPSKPKKKKPKADGKAKKRAGKKAKGGKKKKKA